MISIPTPLLEKLRSNPSVAVITGAGISAPSGVPTFRGEQGLWRNYSPQELATPEAFFHNPSTVWEWYLWRRQEVARCKPNAAHAVLADWSKRFSDFMLITQNVDGLHERVETKNLSRFHGSIWVTRCIECDYEIWDWDSNYTKLPPPCPKCDAFLRPGVVWFGETIPPAAIEAASEALHKELVITVGTSATVYPAASIVTQAAAIGAMTVEINLEETVNSPALDYSLIGSADEVLAAIDKEIARP